MTHPTLKRILSMDKWARVEVDRDLITAQYGVYNPHEGKVYLSQAMADLYFDDREMMASRIRVIDLSHIPAYEEVTA